MAKIIVCLDAGHYGKYNRSPVVKSYYESEMTWKLHLLLKKELESYGIEVWQTRNDQTKDLNLFTRGKKSKGANLFISLHSNASDSETVDRPVAIYFVDDNCGHIDEDSVKVAKILAECVEKVMETKGKGQTYSRKSGNDRDGNGKMDDEYYGVLHGAHEVGTCGIILEHSFHTNTRAAKWLLDDSNLEKLAKAEAETIANYYGLKKPTASMELEPYLVKITAEKALNVRSGPGTSHKVNTVVYRNEVYTIVAEDNGWGKLKSGAGWIKLSYTKKL